MKSKINIHVFKNKTLASDYISDQIINVVKNNPNGSICFATGNTFIETYNRVVVKTKKNNIDWSKFTSFNLDEYINTQHNDNWGYYYFMWNILFKYININSKNINFPPSTEINELKLKYYDNILKKKGVDLQLLGVGSNGHIAFNEPGSDSESKTRVINLSKSTIEDNAKLFFNNKINEVPKKAITMGISNILNSKRIIIAAWGEKKLKAFTKFLEMSNPSPDYPVTFLKNHNNVDFYIDYEIYNLVDKNLLLKYNLKIN